MALSVTDSVADELPSTVKTALSKIEENQQQQFEEDYKRKRRSPGVMLALAILFPIQHFLEGKVGLGILYWLSLGGLGVWYVIDAVLIWGRTKRHNEETGKNILRDMKIMNG